MVSQTPNFIAKVSFHFQLKLITLGILRAPTGKNLKDCSRSDMAVVPLKLFAERCWYDFLFYFCVKLIPGFCSSILGSRYIYSVPGPGSLACIATSYGLDGPGGGEISAPVQTGPGVHTASCTMGTGSLPGIKRGRGVTLTPHPLLVPWSGKGTAIPLLLLWAVRPVQSLSACKRVHFTLLYLYIMFDKRVNKR